MLSLLLLLELLLLLPLLVVDMVYGLRPLLRLQLLLHLLLHWLSQGVLSRRVRFPIKGENCAQQLTSIVHMNTTHQCNHVYAAAAVDAALASASAARP